MKQREEIIEAMDILSRPGEGAARVKEYERRLSREVYKLKMPLPEGSEHYRSGWNDAIEAAFELLRTIGEPGTSLNLGFLGIDEPEHNERARAELIENSQRLIEGLKRV